MYYSTLSDDFCLLPPRQIFSQLQDWIFCACSCFHVAQGLNNVFYRGWDLCSIKFEWQFDICIRHVICITSDAGCRQDMFHTRRCRLLCNSHREIRQCSLVRSVLRADIMCGSLLGPFWIGKHGEARLVLVPRVVQDCGLEFSSEL